MQDRSYNLTDPIFAPITPINSGSICVFRISGNNIIKKFLDITNKTHVQDRMATLIKINDYNKILDFAICIYFQSPNSFTGEDCIEVSLHASEYVCNRFIEILSKDLGFRFALNGEFSYRAFINGKIDLNQAESINNLILSVSESQHTIAIRGIDGKLSQLYQSWLDKLRNILCILEANIDFSDQDISPNTLYYINHELNALSKEIDESLNKSKFSSSINNGFNVCIIGKPNAGKSSLINAIMNQEIAIVSNIPGTTRDIVKAHAIISGYKINFSDTAGIRDSENEIEIEGINRALNAAKNADLRIFLIDPQGYDKKMLDEYFIEGDIIALNKSDINDQKLTCDIEISAKFNINIDKLINLIIAKIANKCDITSNNIILSERQKNILHRAQNIMNNIDINAEIEILAEDLRMCINALGELFGHVSTDDILGDIFSKFCVGK